MNQQSSEITPAGEQEALIARFDDNLRSYKGVIEKMVAQKRLDPFEFMVSFQNTYRKVPKLLECDINTVKTCFLISAEMGLLPNTHSQLSHILPYYNGKTKTMEAQWQIGYQGWIEIFQRNGMHIDTEIVYANDVFEEIKGSKKELNHRPAQGDRGEAIGVYAITFPPNSQFPEWEYLDKDTVMKYKKLSKGAQSNSSPWDSDKDPRLWMWRKTAIHQLAKSLPKTKEIQTAFAAETAAEAGRTIELTEGGELDIPAGVPEEERNQMRNEEKSSKAGESAANLFKDENPS